jgi:multiple sugar transport system permease protein
VSNLSQLHSLEQALPSPKGIRVAKRRRMIRDTVAGYSFIAPTTILFTIFYFIPLVETVLNGFYQFNIMSPTKKFVGLQNYETIIRNGDFQTAIWHTVVYTFFTVLLSTAFSLVVAVLLNQRIRGKTIYRTIYFLPVIAPSIATSIVFSDIFANDNSGVANQILTRLHLHPVAWLGDAHYAMATVIIYSVWSLIGYNMVIYLAGLQNIPESYYEAARLDGASSWGLFRRITLPLLAPTTLFVVVVGVISAFQVFNQVYIMTQGGPLNATTVIVYYIYQEAFQNFQGGTASAMSVILFVILLILSVFQVKLFSRNRF